MKKHIYGDIISGPFCPYLGWSLRWTDNNIYLFLLTKINKEYYHICGNSLSLNNLKKNECFEMSPLILLDFLIENWKSIASPYIKNSNFSGIVDFNKIGIDVNLIINNKTIIVSTSQGNSKNPYSETLMIVESLAKLGDTLAEGLNLLGYDIYKQNWDNVRKYDFIPPVFNEEDLQTNKLEEDIEKTLLWYANFYNLKPGLLKKIILYDFIMQEAYCFLHEEYTVEPKKYEGFYKYKNNSLMSSKELSLLAKKILLKKKELGLECESEWLNNYLISGLYNLRSKIFYSQWPDICYSCPE